MQGAQKLSICQARPRLGAMFNFKLVVPCLDLIWTTTKCQHGMCFLALESKLVQTVNNHVTFQYRTFYRYDDQSELFHAELNFAVQSMLYSRVQ